MTFQIVHEFEAETPSGLLKFKEGQKIRLSKEEAIHLLHEGLIQSIEKVAYKVYSEVLQAYLWVVETDQDMNYLRSQGISEGIYTADEIKKLKGIDKDSLREIHKAKEVFQNSKVHSVNKNNLYRGKQNGKRKT